jgi:hypothetical protein
MNIYTQVWTAWILTSSKQQIFTNAQSKINVKDKTWWSFFLRKFEKRIFLLPTQMGQPGPATRNWTLVKSSLASSLTNVLYTPLQHGDQVDNHGFPYSRHRIYSKGSKPFANGSILDRSPTDRTGHQWMNEDYWFPFHWVQLSYNFTLYNKQPHVAWLPSLWPRSRRYRSKHVWPTRAQAQTSTRRRPRPTRCARSPCASLSRKPSGS